MSVLSGSGEAGRCRSEGAIGLWVQIPPSPPTKPTQTDQSDRLGWVSLCLDTAQMLPFRCHLTWGSSSSRQPRRRVIALERAIRARALCPHPRDSAGLWQRRGNNFRTSGVADSGGDAEVVERADGGHEPHGKHNESAIRRPYDAPDRDNGCGQVLRTDTPLAVAPLALRRRREGVTRWPTGLRAPLYPPRPSESAGS